MEIQASRFAARIGTDGSLVPLTEQNRARWDRLLIRRGLAALARAEALGGAQGPYALQAALAACHARAATPEETDWRRIAGLYDIVARGPAVAGGRAQSGGGAQHGLRPGGWTGAARARSKRRPRCAATRRCRRQRAIFYSGRQACRGARGIRARGRADAERARKGIPAQAGGGLRTDARICAPAKKPVCGQALSSKYGLESARIV